MTVVVAEWLRRWTRNPLGSPRADSNPADYEKRMSILALQRECFFYHYYLAMNKSEHFEILI